MRVGAFLARISGVFGFKRKAPLPQPVEAPAEISGPEERRRQERKERYFECTWVSDWSEERARVSSLSPAGCYVECRSDVPSEGSPLTAVTITLPTGELTLRGTVIHSIRGVGFGVEFTDVSEEAHATLIALTAS